MQAQALVEHKQAALEQVHPQVLNNNSLTHSLDLEDLVEWEVWALTQY